MVDVTHHRPARALANRYLTKIPRVESEYLLSWYPALPARCTTNNPCPTQYLLQTHADRRMATRPEFETAPSTHHHRPRNSPGQQVRLFPFSDYIECNAASHTPGVRKLISGGRLSKTCECIIFRLTSWLHGNHVW